MFRHHCSSLGKAVTQSCPVRGLQQSSGESPNVAEDRACKGRLPIGFENGRWHGCGAGLCSSPIQRLTGLPTWVRPPRDSEECAVLVSLCGRGSLRP